MDHTKPIDLGIAEKLKKDESYCKAFFRAYVTDSIAIQIRELRKARNLKQAELAEAANMKQSAISRLEKAAYSSWTFNTLLRIAEALNARLVIKFEAIEDAIRKYQPAEASLAKMSSAIGQATSLKVYRHMHTAGRIEKLDFHQQSAPWIAIKQIRTRDASYGVARHA